MGERLSNRRRVFVEEYLRCWNASEAARRAGYKGRANTIGERLLSNVDIQTLIRARLDALKMGTDEVLARLAEHARGDIGEIITKTGRVDLALAKREGRTHLIKSVHRDRGGSRVEMYDAQAALVQIGRALGMFVDKTALTDPTGQKEFGTTGLSDDERAARIAAIFDAARARRPEPADGA